jgi:hypothetical protein
MDAFVGVHAVPHALQLLVVSRSVQVPPHSVSLHVHVPALQSGVGWAHVVPLTQVPAAEHVWGVLPLQRTAADTHTPASPPPASAPVVASVPASVPPPPASGELHPLASNDHAASPPGELQRYVLPSVPQVV